MRLPILASGLVLLSAVALSQTTPRTRRLRADLQFLTSDVLEGRVSLSREARIAAQYIASDFERTGLLPAAGGGSFLQEFPLIAYRSDPRGRGLRLTRGGSATVLRPGTDFNGSFMRDFQLRAPVVFAGFGISAPEYTYDDYANLDVAGKIVLIFDHEPREDDPRSIFNGTGHTLHAGRSVKIANARRHGAAAVLIASEPLRSHPGLLDPPPGGTDQRPPLRASAPTQALDDDAQIPAFSIADHVLTELLSALNQQPAELQRAIDKDLKPRSALLPGVIAELRSHNAEAHRGVSANVLGLLEGSDPVLKSETIAITAHYDHLGLQNGRVYPGANDNASGTAAVMELARMFTAGGARPKRSLLFAVFGSEEQLMLGSFYYTAHPTRTLAGTRAVLNLDMIGRDEAGVNTANRLNLVGTYYSADLLQLIGKANQKVGLTLDTKLDRDHIVNALFRCDHLPFLLAGVPAVWLFGGFHPGYHEPSDTVDALNFEKMEKVIRLAFLTAAAASGGTAPE